MQTIVKSHMRAGRTVRKYNRRIKKRFLGWDSLNKDFDEFNKKTFSEYNKEERELERLKEQNLVREARLQELEKRREEAVLREQEIQQARTDAMKERQRLREIAQKKKKSKSKSSYDEDDLAEMLNSFEGELLYG